MDGVESRGDGKVKPQNFWTKVSVSENGCWQWTGCRFATGYAQFHNKRAHRVSWVLERGRIPDGLFVLHHCDNKLCVRPDHLFLGTQLDNIKDMFSKGRENKAKGENHGHAKLSESLVKGIRASCGTHQEIANRHNVSRSTISLIKSGARWNHV